MAVEVAKDVTMTIDKDWELGEMSTKERAIALRHISEMKGRRGDAVKDFDPYDLGVNVVLNGRHVAHFGATFGVKKGGTLTRAQLCEIVLEAMKPYIDDATARPLFTEQEKFILLGRDE